MSPYKICTLLLFVCFISTAADAADAIPANKPAALWILKDGLAQPESVVYDAQRQRVYVSNINGNPLEKDGNGYIATVSLDGRLINKEWVRGLNAPKGMAIVKETLYVADIDKLVAINLNSGKFVGHYAAVDAKFLNDVTADQAGNVYVSDMLTDTIWCLCQGNFAVWLQSADLANPNGLLAESKRLVVNSWGVIGAEGGFATPVPGHLMAVDYKDKKITAIGDGKPVGNLDGVESDGKTGYYVTDWMAGKLFHIDATGKEVQELLSLKQGSADLAYIADKNLLLIPMMKDNQLWAFKTDTATNANPSPR